VITGYLAPVALYCDCLGPYGITPGPDGKLWFSNTGYNMIGEVVFPTADLSVSPGSGSCEVSLTFTGSGFAPNENVRIYSEGIGSAILASATADASGSFTAAVQPPQSPYGPRLFLGLGQTSGDLGAASFSSTPQLFLNPNSGAPDSSVTVQGCGFGSVNGLVSGVNIYWDNPRTFDGTFRGASALTFTVPARAPAGGNGVIGSIAKCRARPAPLTTPRGYSFCEALVLGLGRPTIAKCSTFVEFHSGGADDPPFNA
jgi:hypothetical protein